MNVLILHGPNMNLIGLQSAQIGERITLDKIDTALKRQAKKLEITLKTLQTHKVSKVITFLQQNRNWADGLLFSPGAWSMCQHDILDTLLLTKIPFIEIFLSPKFMTERYATNSIFHEISLDMVIDHPITAYTEGLKKLHNFLLTDQ